MKVTVITKGERWLSVRVVCLLGFRCLNTSH
jgi:hypothetical protein